MSRILALTINVLLVACMLVASPLLFALALGLGTLRGVRVLARKIKHRRLGCVRYRRRARSNLYPETAI
jgi:hypothetical protein